MLRYGLLLERVEDPVGVCCCFGGGLVDLVDTEGCFLCPDDELVEFAAGAKVEL